MQGTVNAYTDIPVLIQSVPRGEIVSAADVAIEKVEIRSDFDHIIVDKVDIIGKQAKGAACRSATEVQPAGTRF